MIAKKKNVLINKSCNVCLGKSFVDVDIWKFNYKNVIYQMWYNLFSWYDVGFISKSQWYNSLKMTFSNPCNKFNDIN